MRYYGLSRQKVLGVIKRPERIEKGIAGNNTIAVMQPVSPKLADGKKVWKQEVWAMYQTKVGKTIFGKTKKNADTKSETLSALRAMIGQDKQLKIISAWRYPGTSPKNNPIPTDILRELEEEGIV